MRKMESSKMRECLWALRFEMLGLILLAIATGMTIFSGNGLGIVALFAAGVIFCLFNKGCLIKAVVTFAPQSSQPALYVIPLIPKKNRLQSRKRGIVQQYRLWIMRAEIKPIEKDSLGECL